MIGSLGWFASQSAPATCNAIVPLLQVEMESQGNFVGLSEVKAATRTVMGARIAPSKITTTYDARAPRWLRAWTRSRRECKGVKVSTPGGTRTHTLPLRRRMHCTAKRLESLANLVSPKSCLHALLHLGCISEWFWPPRSYSRPRCERTIARTVVGPLAALSVAPSGTGPHWSSSISWHARSRWKMGGTKRK